LKESSLGCDAKNSSLRVRAFRFAVIDIFDVDPIFQIFLPLLLQPDPVFVTFFVSVAHDPSPWCPGKSTGDVILRCPE